MNFIKKAIDKASDEDTHIQFQKFSKGEFTNRAIINARFAGGKYTINTSAEFGNDLVKEVAKKLGANTTKVTGAIVSTSDLKNDLKFKEIKQFQGVKRYMIEDEMNGNQIIELIRKFPKAFFGLSFNAGDTSLKIKAKAPKSGKPGTKGEEAPKADFCKLITTDKNLAQSFVFENPEFKKAEIVHKYLIDNIVIPSELKEEKDFAKIRELSKRAGKIIRKSMIDGKEMLNEFGFEA